MLLRFNGIPSRVAVGFTSGELQGDIYTVTTNNAHAWVEVYFPQVGWVAFDPTPGRNIPTPGPSSSSPGFVNPFNEDGAGAGGTTNPTLPASRPLEEGPTDTNPTNGGASVWAKISWLPWALAAIIVIAAWPMVRSAWRKRGLRGGTAAQRLQVSLRLLKSELTDYGVPVSPACTVGETFEIVRAQLRLETEPYFPDRVDAILFGGRAATPEDVAQSEQLRRKAGSRLRRKHGWVRAGLAWYGVPRRSPAEGTSA